jgi:hypothetical protein
MTKRDKLIKRFRDNDRNVRFEEIDGLLERLGFDKKCSGSHNVYRMQGVPNIIIPFRKPFILPVYVRNVLELIDEYLGEEQD